MSLSAGFEAFKGKELGQTGRDVLGSAIRVGGGWEELDMPAGRVSRRGDMDLGRSVSC